MSGPDHDQRYGAWHRSIRKHYRLRLAAGETFTCTKCGQPVTKATPEWDLGHVEGGGPRDYSGPQHRSCNRATNQPEAKQRSGCGPPWRRMTASWHGEPPRPTGLMCPDRDGQPCDCGRYQ